MHETREPRNVQGYCHNGYLFIFLLFCFVLQWRSTFYDVLGGSTSNTSMGIFSASTKVVNNLSSTSIGILTNTSNASTFQQDSSNSSSNDTLSATLLPLSINSNSTHGPTAICRRSVDPSCPRVAWLFAGQTRTFGVSFVHQSIIQNGINSFGGDATSLFFRKIEEDSDPGGLNPVTVDEPGVEMAIAALNCSKIVLAHPFVSGTPIETDCPFMTGNPTKQRNVGQMISQANVYKLLLEEETRQGFKFDVVVHARPDVAWLAPIPSWHSWPLSGSRGWYPGEDYAISPSHGVGDPDFPPFPPAWIQNCFEAMPADMFALLTRPAAAVFYSAYERYLNCTPPFPPKYFCCGGGITALWMELMSTSTSVDSWARWPFPIMLVRRMYMALTSNMCNQSYDGFAGDWMQRCAKKPIPGCQM